MDHKFSAYPLFYSFFGFNGLPVALVVFHRVIVYLFIVGAVFRYNGAVDFASPFPPSHSSETTTILAPLAERYVVGPASLKPRSLASQTNVGVYGHRFSLSNKCCGAAEIVLDCRSAAARGWGCTTKVGPLQY